MDHGRFCAAVVAVVLLAQPAAAWAFGFQIEPARIELSVPAGKRRGQTLSVTNQKPEGDIHLASYARDLRSAPDGTYEYPEAGSTAWSAATWIEVVPGELDVAAKTTQQVRLSVSAPEGATGGHYAMVFFESTPGYAEGSGVGVNFRIGVLVEVVIPGTERFEAQLKNVALEAPNRLRVDFFNAGNVLVRPVGAVKVFDAAGKKAAEWPFNPKYLGVLPDTLRYFMTDLDKPLPPGRYRARVEIDYGGPALVVGERAFDIP